MFVLKDLPSHEVLNDFAKEFHNPDVDKLYTWLIWASATNDMLSRFELNLSQFGLSQTQFFVLILLKRNPDGLKIGELASGIGITSQTMTRVVDRMEKNKLCCRYSDPQDRRAWVIQLSHKGEAILAKVLPAHYEWVATLMSKFSDEERQVLECIMSKYLATLNPKE